MTNKSTAIVGFIANLMPLYFGEHHENAWCARSLQDGTLILPFSAGEDSGNEGWIRVCWQGDRQRETEVLGETIAALALERFVRLHGTGVHEEAIAAELCFLAQHFTFKTGCYVYLPQLSQPPHPVVRVVRRMGEGVLVNLLSKIAGG